MNGAARIFRSATLGLAQALTVAGVICLGLSGCQMAPKPIAPAWTIPPGVVTQTVNGYPIAYSSRGTGPTIVFDHGVLLDYRYWQQPLEAWTGDYRVVAISMRHFYPEHWDGKGDDFTVSQHAKDLAACIESIGGPVYLVGWSYGGAAAYEVARTRPDLVKKLVLVEGGPDLRPKPADFVPKADPTGRAAKAQKFFDAGDMDGGLAYAVDEINGGPGHWAALPEESRQQMRENAWTIVGIGRGDPYTGTCAEFGALKMPVLLVKGEITAPPLRDIVLAQAKCLPQATVVTIPKAGHASARMNPPAFKEAVYSFLQH